jgi:hypothetical protein
MSGPITVIPPRQALVDERGNITRVWWLFLQEIFTRIGGSNAMTNTELEAAINEAALAPLAVVEPMPGDVTPVAMITMPADEWFQMSARLSELDAIVADMAQQINGMKQGPSL